VRKRDNRARWVRTTSCSCSCSIVGNGDRALNRWFGNESTARGSNRVDDSLLGVLGSSGCVQVRDVMVVVIVVLVLGLGVLNEYGSC
jgi:hypothetical protein